MRDVRALSIGQFRIDKKHAIDHTPENHSVSKKMRPMLLLPLSLLLNGCLAFVEPAPPLIDLTYDPPTVIDSEPADHETQPITKAPSVPAEQSAGIASPQDDGRLKTALDNHGLREFLTRRIPPGTTLEVAIAKIKDLGFRESHDHGCTVFVGLPSQSIAQAGGPWFVLTDTTAQFAYRANVGFAVDASNCVAGIETDTSFSVITAGAPDLDIE